ncbi:hypothetical protein Cgig2_029007 [Carnegiea gigantea]|uniref:glutathione transferase n=1 Tax=Carnegiea gigantea TaxID=171969 RepID=A0A9Q1Q8J7_9CARY|nr:hypothetical protein Cgig2_029007 [Carnegiea gigantea]
MANVGDHEVILLNAWQSPFGARVPVLIHNRKPICDSLNIVEYIDHVWKGKSCPSLFPDDPYERAQTRFWANFIDQKIYANIRKIWLSKTDAEVGKKELIESLKTLEKELEERTYYGGDKFGVVDIALVGFYTRFCTAETTGGFKLKEECPKLVAWAKRCMQRESVLHSLPDPHNMLGFSLQLKHKLAVD